MSQNITEFLILNTEFASWLDAGITVSEMNSCGRTRDKVNELMCQKLRLAKPEISMTEFLKIKPGQAKEKKDWKEEIQSYYDYLGIAKKAKTTDIETVLKNIPALIIINEDGIQENIIKLCDKIRANEDNSITPIIVISSITEKQHRVQILQACVEHYIKAPIDEEYLYYTVKNVIRLLDTNRRVSPLTGLPGNVQIQAEIKKR